MRRIIISFFMIFSVIVGHASAASQSGLKNAFDELSYSLNVEWDQEDMTFFNAQKDKFAATVKAEGISPNQLVEILNEEITDVQTRRDIVEAFQLVKSKNMTQEEAQEHIMNVLSQTYAEGAHWNPLSKVGSFFKTAGIVALSVVVLILFSQTGAFQGATI